MIYNAYQFYAECLEGKNYWGAFRKEIPKSEVALRRLQPVTWKEQSTSEIAQNLKTVFNVLPVGASKKRGN